MLGKSEVGGKLLKQQLDGNAAGGMTIASTPSGYPFAIAQILNGEIAQGFQTLETWRVRYKSWNYFPGEATYHLYRGEALLEMAIGKEKPPMAVLKKNLWFLLRTAPFAASMARRHLQSAVGLFKHYDMPVLES